MPDDDSVSELRLGMARLEAKIDTVIIRHDAKLEEHGRRIGENAEKLHDHEQTLNSARVTMSELSTRTSAFPDELRSMEKRLSQRIEAMKPAPIWPTLTAIVAAVALILSVAQQLYGA